MKDFIVLFAFLSVATFISFLYFTNEIDYFICQDKGITTYVGRSHPLEFNLKLGVCVKQKGTLVKYNATKSALAH